MSLEAWLGLAALALPVLSYVGARVGVSAAMNVHLEWLRRDVDETRRSARSAHWRLDEINAPPAPTVER